MKKELLHFVEWKKIPEEKVESTLENLVSWGVKNIVAHPVWFRNGEENYVSKMAARLQSFGLRATACHALWGVGNDCLQYEEELWQKMVRKHQDFLAELTELEVSTYTIHLGFKPGDEAKDIFPQLRRTVDALLPAAEKNRIALALENSSEPVPVIEELNRMVSSYRSEFLGLCYDSGHANCYQNSVESTLEIMRENIVTCHLHDNYGSFDDHNPPGGGNTNWAQLDALLDTLPRLHHAETESGDWDQDSWNKFCAACGKNCLQQPLE